MPITSTLHCHARLFAQFLVASTLLLLLSADDHARRARLEADEIACAALPEPDWEQHAKSPLTADPKAAMRFVNDVARARQPQRDSIVNSSFKGCSAARKTELRPARRVPHALSRVSNDAFDKLVGHWANTPRSSRHRTRYVKVRKAGACVERYCCMDPTAAIYRSRNKELTCLPETRRHARLTQLGMNFNLLPDEPSPKEAAVRYGGCNMAFT